MVISRSSRAITSLAMKRTCFRQSSEEDDRDGDKINGDSALQRFTAGLSGHEDSSEDKNHDVDCGGDVIW